MTPDIQTRFITLIGTPLGQSFAARMQNTAYAAMGQNLCYFYTEADETHLGDIIRGIRCMPSMAGCAVTKPNKVKVLQYLDELDPLCRKMGACNTVVKTADGRLVGYNTDGTGFYISLTQEAGLKADEHRYFLIGAGGAGRAICSALAYHGAQKIYVNDYFPAAAEALVKDINDNFAPCAQFVEYGDYSMTADCDVIINASGIGMGATMGQSPMPAEYILPDKHILYFDACYNPDRTQFLLNAQEKGCRVMNGLGMSLYQGAAQIELWTGEKAPADIMREELLAILKEQEATA